MKKIISSIALILLFIVFLLIGSAFYLSHYIDPNKYKGRISQYVFAKTGQVLVINGDIKWSVFPWVGLKVKNLLYYNAHQFSPKVFISAKEMDMKIKLIPLLTKKIEIGNITLNNAIINLTRNKDGTVNWQSFAKTDKKIITEKNNLSSNKLATMIIESLRIKDGKINWLDQLDHTQTRFTSINVISHHIQFGKFFPFALELKFAEKKGQDVAVQLHANILIPHHTEQVFLKNFVINSQSQDKNIHLQLVGDLATDISQKTTNAKFNFNLNDMSGRLELETDKNNPDQLTGLISTNNFNGNKFLLALGQNLNFENPTALSSASLISKLRLTKNIIQFQQLHAIIDQTDIYGSIIVSKKNKSVLFDLSANAIDLKNYCTESTKSKTSSIIAKNQSKEKKLPPATYAIKGRFQLAKLIVNKLLLTNLNAQIAAANHIINISPLQASCCQGRINGSLIIDKRQPNLTTVFIKQKITNLKIQELLHQFSNADKLTGNAELTLDLTSTIDRKRTFLSTLNGKVAFILNDGSLRGIDIIYQLSKAHSFIKHLHPPSMTNSKKTAFSALSANALITNGILSTDDILLTSEYLKVSGKGSTNLSSNEIRYHLNALAQPKLSDEYREIGKEITTYNVPIKITGTFIKPNVNLDFSVLTKMLLVKKIEKPLTDHLQKLKNGLQDKMKHKFQKYPAAKILSKLIGDR